MTIPILNDNPSDSRRIVLLMDLASTCDLRCIHCYRSVLLQRGANMTLDQIGVLEREVFPYIQNLSLSCAGEPLTRSNFREGLRAAKRAGVPFIRIQTNATYLKEEMSRFLIESGLDYMGVSLDAATKETYETIRRGGHWEEVIGNLRTFSRLRRESGETKPTVGLNFTLLTLNTSDARDFIGLAAELGADLIGFSHLLLESWEAKQWSLRYDPNRMNDLLAELREESAKFDIPVHIPEDVSPLTELFEGPPREGVPSHSGRCAAAEEDWLFMMPNGDLFPCGNLQDQGPLGNVFETPFEELWFGDRNQTFRDEALNGCVRGCDSCKLFAPTRDLNREITYLAKRLTTRSAEAMDFGEVHAKRRVFHRPERSRTNA
ncbi:MAG: radical SAM protein [Candidatus Omnitrophica bacterium]|nr:radical SAM protein [Candidatus Omnitrophota bacterium]